MANRKRGPFRWILLGLTLILGGVAFFSLRGIGRTPAKIDPEKLAAAMNAVKEMLAGLHVVR